MWGCDQGGIVMVEGEDAREGSTHWRIDRHIPIAIVIGLFIQTATWIWWAAAFSTATNTRLDAVENRQKSMDQLPERLTRQEERLESTNLLLRDIRDELRLQRSQAQSKK